jgi:hypothetical protein
MAETAKCFVNLARLYPFARLFPPHRNSPAAERHLILARLFKANGIKFSVEAREALERLGFEKPG